MAASHSVTPLVGRARELGAIDTALATIDRRRGPCVAFAGALGLGKSRLLRELEERAEAGRNLVLETQGSELEAGIPYGVISDALEGYLGALPAPELARLGDGLASELAPVLPSLAPELAASRGQTIEAERYRTHRALSTLFERLAERRPLVLVIDDLHWADAETSELVAHLIRHPTPRTVASNPAGSWAGR